MSWSLLRVASIRQERLPSLVCGLRCDLAEVAGEDESA